MWPHRKASLCLRREGSTRYTARHTGRSRGRSEGDQEHTLILLAISFRFFFVFPIPLLSYTAFLFSPLATRHSDPGSYSKFLSLFPALSFPPCAVIAIICQPFLSSPTRVQARLPTMLGALRSVFLSWYVCNDIRNFNLRGIRTPEPPPAAFEGNRCTVECRRIWLRCMHHLLPVRREGDAHAL